MLRKVFQFQRGNSNISRKERLNDSKDLYLRQYRTGNFKIGQINLRPLRCSMSVTNSGPFVTECQYDKSYQHDVTYQKTVLFTVTATTSNVTNIISFNIYQNDTTIKCKSLSQYKYFIPWKCCFIRQIPFLTRKIGLRDYHAICVCVCGGGVLSF